MSFLALIFIIIILVVVWPVIKVAMTVKNYQRKVRDAFRQATGQQSGSSEPGERRGGWSRAPRVKKKITHDVGEYVEWEEITTSTVAEDQAGNTYTSFRREEQVTDVEWEDI